MNRVIRLLPCTQNNALIQGLLFACPIVRGCRPIQDGDGLCDALSYSWGSPDNPREIYVENKDPSAGFAVRSAVSSSKRVVRVAANLHQALSRLRHPYVDRILWIDAVYINQNYITQGNRQVSMGHPSDILANRFSSFT